MLFYISSGVSNAQAGCLGQVSWPAQSGSCVAGFSVNQTSYPNLGLLTCAMTETCHACNSL